MKTQVTITMDVDVKKGLQSFAKEIGMNMSILLNLSARELIQTRRLDFDFSKVLTSEDEKARKEALDDLKEGKNIYTREDFEKHFNNSVDV